MNISFAPLQGYTDAAYRRFHNQVYGDCIDCYYTPFIHLHNGEPRHRDIRDIEPGNNPGITIVPQIICRDANEFHTLVNAVIATGHTHIDINMGCPFPPQSRKGRGSGLLAHPDAVSEIVTAIDQYPQLTFSIKMRLGLDGPEQAINLLPTLNQARLTHITMHPRIGTQQYKGTVDMLSFAQFMAKCEKPVIYNGDITTPEQIGILTEQYPDLHGIMIGRGLLARPSLAHEYQQGITLGQEEQIERMLELHSLLYEHYSTVLQGDAQLLTKIKTFWDHLESLIGHKPHKAIKKASSIAKYNAAIQAI